MDALTPCSCDGMTDSSDSSSELDLAADFAAALLLDDDSDDGDRGSAGACGATAGGADRAISEPASHKYRDVVRAHSSGGVGIMFPCTTDHSDMVELVPGTHAVPTPASISVSLSLSFLLLPTHLSP